MLPYTIINYGVKGKVPAMSEVRKDIETLEKIDTEDPARARG
jgi:hypothetical protein